MAKTIIVLSLISLISACNVTQAPPYEADKAVEDRENYSGTKGMVQYGKDQNYLAKKELSDKCERARIDLAVAINEGDEKQVKAQEGIIQRNCVK
ncbi:hypothetical protein [Planctobacterium marinum]|uniref:Lipoprotein n=1 Tax=Planctobacterium marinum TaxID=1631968 RepID=A0AA48KRI5_9ALTE|nr:hypothetical protein MACH26_16730 [Planctobacterium marinum]